MKTIILYETQKGYTKGCAEKLSSSLDSADMFDMQRQKFNIEEFDVILIGTPIYDGKIGKTTENFFKENKWKLLDKRLGVFCAGMNTKEFNRAMQESLPGEIFLHAEIVHCGGLIEYHSLKWLERRFVKKRFGITETTLLDYSYKLDELVKWVNQ